MIEALNEKNRTAALKILAADPLFGGRIAAALLCYESRPELRQFYLAGEAAVLMAGGTSAVLCGSVSEETAEELESFFAFAGIRSLSAESWAPRSWQIERVVRMTCPAGSLRRTPQFDLPRGWQLDENPSLWNLRKAGLPAGADGDDWYSDSCMQQNRGTARIFAACRLGTPAAMAGLYAVGPRSACLSAVETLTPHRGQGIASALVSALLESAPRLEIQLLCRPGLTAFYERIGFIACGTALQAVNTEEKS